MMGKLKLVFKAHLTAAWIKEKSIYKEKDLC